MAIVQDAKPCTKCGIVKPVADFAKCAANRDGLQCWCRECKSSHRRDTYPRTRPDNLARDGVKPCYRCGRTLSVEMFHKSAEKSDGLQTMCKECKTGHIAERVADGYWKSRYWANDLAAVARARYATDPVYRSRRRELNRLAHSMHGAEWYRRDIANSRRKKRHLQMVRKARQRGAAGSCSRAAFDARWAYYGGRCWMCGEEATAMDHVIALARGGSNWPANLRPACVACNSRKRDRDWRQFISE